MLNTRFVAARAIAHSCLSLFVAESHNTLRYFQSEGLQRPANDTFAWLVSPMDVETFLATKWERQPVVLKRTASHYTGLFSVDDFPSIVFRQTRSTSAHNILFLGQEFVTDRFPQPYDCYLLGGSLVINHVDVLHRPLFELHEKLAEIFPYSFSNFYLTPSNAQAVHPHSDNGCVFVVQLWGRKSWQVYGDTELVYKHEQQGKEERIPRHILSNPRIDEYLDVGDVLYIPRGTIHQARTSESPSLHVTITIPSWDFTWGQQLRNMVEEKISGRKYRHSVPFRFHATGNSESVREYFNELTKDMFDYGEMQASFALRIQGHRARTQQDAEQVFAQSVPKMPKLASVMQLDASVKIHCDNAHATFAKDAQTMRIPITNETEKALEWMQQTVQFIVGDIPHQDDFSKLSLVMVLYRNEIVHLKEMALQDSIPL